MKLRFECMVVFCLNCMHSYKARNSFTSHHITIHSVGAGVNIFVRYVMHAKEGDPDMRGLVAISPMLHKAGWREWGFEKVARAEIRAGQKHLPSFIVNQNLHR